jgi:hypothetical protein
MMGRMAGKTIIHGLPLRMWLVALGAFGNLPVHAVTECAGLLGMSAGELLELLALFLVASKTGTCDIIGKHQSQRIMGIGMAGQAVLEFEMGFPGMAFGTGRNGVGSPRGMFLMTVKAGYRCGMLATFGSDSSRFLVMTFYAVANGQLGGFRRSRRQGKQYHRHYRQN